ncbi:MAG: hypothetical protein Q9N34_10825 [Aquificota bacterium]|nr:hypothetical protein [Aquificota bacterium]
MGDKRQEGSHPSLVGLPVQENLEKGYSDVAKIHPNYAYDWYPHAKPPYRYPEDWANQYALAYIGGEKVLRKNTFRTPVREVVAEGFGSSTWKDVQSAEGSGRLQERDVVRGHKEEVRGRELFQP